MAENTSLPLLKGILLSNFKDAENSYSARRFLESAASFNMDIKILRPQDFDLIVTENKLLVNGEPYEMPDFVMPRMGSTTNFRAFSVLKHLENLGARIINNAQAVYCVQNKLMTHEMLARHQLSTPKTILSKSDISLDLVEKEIGFPLIIKNVCGTNGAGIYLCESKEKLEDVLEMIYTNKADAQIMIQQFIGSSRGKDLRVFTIGHEAVACMQRSAISGFKANVAKGASVLAYEMSDDIRKIASEISQLFQLDVAGIDLLFAPDGSFTVCEVNSAPGFEGLERAHGHIIAEKVLSYIRHTVSVHQQRKKLSDSSSSQNLMFNY